MRGLCGRVRRSCIRRLIVSESGADHSGSKRSSTFAFVLSSSLPLAGNCHHTRLCGVSTAKRFAPGFYLREGFARNVGQVPLLISESGLTSTEIYFRTEDLGRFIARLEQAGARTLSPLALRDWGDEADFADPDGNIIVAARAVSN